jgi:hypothetical protein
MFDLCASHPDISMGYESKLPVEGISVHRRVADRLRPSVPTRRDAMAELFAALQSEIDDPTNTELFTRLSRAEVVDHAAAANDESPGWPTICSVIFRSLEGTSHWGNKLLRVELIPTLTALWPDARFLVLTRDPRGVITSQSEKFDHSLEYNAMYWNTHATFVREQLGLGPGEHDERHFVVDLVAAARDPRPALEWAFSGIGVDTAPIEGLLERFPGDPDRLDNWRTVLEPTRQRRVEELCFEPMRALGYQPELATAGRTIGRGRRLVVMARQHGAELLRDPGSIRRKQVGRRVRAALHPNR